MHHPVAIPHCFRPCSCCRHHQQFSDMARTGPVKRLWVSFVVCSFLGACARPLKDRGKDCGATSITLCCTICSNGCGGWGSRMPAMYALMWSVSVLRVARVCFLWRIEANVCCNSSDNAFTCVTGEVSVQCNIGGRGLQSQRHDTLTIQVHNVSGINNGPWRDQASTRLRHVMPWRPWCQDLCKLVPLFQEVQEGNNSNHTAPWVFHMLIC